MKPMQSMMLDEEDSYDAVLPMPVDRPEYPYELRVTLTDKTMAKLGLDPAEALAGIGGTVMVHSLARITSASMDQREGGDPCCRVELQIEEMAVDGDGEDAPPIKRGLASIYKS